MGAGKTVFGVTKQAKNVCYQAQEMPLISATKTRQMANTDRLSKMIG